MPNEIERDWQDGRATDLLPLTVADAYAELEGPLLVRRLGGGLLHHSFHLRTDTVDYVLQKVSDVFAPEVQENIEAVTQHLASKAFPTFTLCRTKAGHRTVAVDGHWRLLTHLGGQSFDALPSAADARSAGALVGRFHAALRDFEAPLAPLGIPYRETDLYLQALRTALEEMDTHRLREDVAPLARRVFDAFANLGPGPRAPQVPTRVLHGDLKLANLLFESPSKPADSEGREAFALVDFDTLMRGPLWMDLGDAWRSWCNRALEDEGGATFDLVLFEASARGFFDAWGESMPPDETESLVDAPERLALEVCARFLTDALEESYFGWDAERFPGAGEHHLARARGQWVFAESAKSLRDERARILRDIVGD